MGGEAALGMNPEAGKQTPVMDYSRLDNRLGGSTWNLHMQGPHPHMLHLSEPTPPFPTLPLIRYLRCWFRYRTGRGSWAVGGHKLLDPPQVERGHILKAGQHGVIDVLCVA